MAYASRKLSDAEWDHHSNALECLAVVCSLDDKFRHYLFGREFTENAGMTWIFAKCHLKHKFTRWIITLEGYTYHVRHRPGALNQVADALSRHPTGDCSPSRRGDSWILFGQEDVEKAQRDDHNLVAIIVALNTPSGNSNFFLRNGTLYRRVWFKNHS